MTADKRLVKATDEDIALEICDHPEEYFDPQLDWATDFLKFGSPSYHERFEGLFVPKPLRKKHAIQPTGAPRSSWTLKKMLGAGVSLSGIGMMFFSLTLMASGNHASVGSGLFGIVFGCFLLLTGLVSASDTKWFDVPRTENNEKDAVKPQAAPAIDQRSDADVELDSFFEDLETIDDLDNMTKKGEK